MKDFEKLETIALLLKKNSRKVAKEIALCAFASLREFFCHDYTSLAGIHLR